MNISRARAAVICAVFLAAPAAGAASLPNWNVTLPGNIVQHVALAGRNLIIDRNFGDHKARFTVPLKTVASIGAPYAGSGGWNIVLKLKAKATLSSTLTTGAVETMQTDAVLVQFLTKADAAAGRTYLLAQSGA